MSMTLFDCSLFHNEHEILAIRDEILGADVDHMMLVEGNRTFQGEPRSPQHSPNGIQSWYIPLPGAEAKDHWEREQVLRDSIKHTLAMNYEMHDDDVVMISDVDEIPHPEKLSEACEYARAGEIVCFQQIHTYFAIDLVDDEPWYGTRALTWAKLRTTTPQNIRSVAHYEGQILIREGGWHFGWTGGNDAIREKVRSFCHDNLNDPHLVSDSYLNHCRKVGQTIHNSHRLRKLDHKLLPAVIQENEKRYRHLFA